MTSWLARQLGGGRRRLLAAATVLTLGGISAITIGLTVQQVAPTPAAPAPNPSATTPSDLSSATTAPTESGAPALTAAQPTAIGIPEIGVQSSLITVGLNPDGSMQVPQKGPDYDKAAWYKFSPTAGEIGPSVIIGHVDSAANGPSVFFRLGAMKPGDTVSVSRIDGTVAVFTVDRVEQYSKDEFPTLEVYGNTDNAQLRLITCGGEFDDGTSNYLDNIVVYAHLTG